MALPDVSDEAVAREAIQRGLLDPWAVDDILENDVVPSLQRIEQLLERQQLPPGEPPAGDVVGLLEEIARNTGDVVRREVIENLPLEATGTTIERIQEGQTGQAIFELNGTRFVADVTTTITVDAFDPVRVVEPGNVVRRDPEVAEDRALIEVPRIEPEATVRLANQTWTNTSVEFNPTVELVSFSGDLGPGDIETVASAESTVDEISLDGIALGVTSHKGDIDGDASTPDESIVRYHVQYKTLTGAEPVTDWTEFPWSPTVLPIGDLANPVQVIAGAYVGPIHAIRIRLENRTDEGTLVDHTVAEEALGGLIEARAVV